MKIVNIISGSGFLGSHNTQKVSEGKIKEKISALDISEQEKYNHLLKLKNKKNLEILQFNIENKSEFANLSHGCSIIIHGGAPF